MPCFLEQEFEQAVARTSSSVSKILSRPTLKILHTHNHVDVQLDEGNTVNESYVCFRGRETKAIRKTRAQQPTYSDKMIRSQSELATAMELANRVLQREAIKHQESV